MTLITSQITASNPKFSKCQLTLSSGSATLSNCQEDSSLYLGGQPWSYQLGNGNYYAISSTNVAKQNIVTLNSDAGIIDTIDLNEVFAKTSIEEGVFGGLATVVDSSAKAGHSVSKKSIPRAADARNDMRAYTGKVGFVVEGRAQKECIAKCSTFRASDEQSRLCFERCKNVESKESAKPWIPYRKQDLTGGSCTAPGEFCCEAPMDDPNNCPPGASTSDCAAKKSCCCY